MFSAIDQGDIDKVEQLLKEGYGANGHDWGHIAIETPLHCAVQTRFTNIVTVLLDAGADINRMNLKRCSPIYLAARCGQKKNVELLLERGADVSIGCPTGHVCGTLMNFTAAMGIDIVSVLVRRGHDVNSGNNSGGGTPLFDACEAGHCNVANSLLRHGANMHLKNLMYDHTMPTYWMPIDYPKTRHLLIHWNLVEIVLSLSPLDLPGYVLLWISDWLPYFVAAETEYNRITVITRTINSIRRVREARERHENVAAPAVASLRKNQNEK